MKHQQLLLFSLALLIASMSVFSLTKYLMAPKTQDVSPPVEKEYPAHIPEVIHQPRTTFNTNEWWSSANEFPTENLFAFPGVYKITSEGLQLTQPKIVGTEKTVFSGLEFQCTVSTNQKIQTVTVKEYADWNVTLTANSSAGDWDIQLIQGSPTAYLSKLNAPLHIWCDGSRIEQTESGVKVISPNYVLLVEAETLENVETPTLHQGVITSSTGRYRLSYLPDETAQIQKLFSQQPWQEIITTQLDWEIIDQEILTHYYFQTSQNLPTFTTIWPHQKVLGKHQVLGEYQTLNGPLTLILTNSFTTSSKIPNLAKDFVKVQDEAQQSAIKTAIARDAELYLSKEIPDGVYFRGTEIGAISSLIQLTKTYDMTIEYDQLIVKLEKLLIESNSQFKYDPDTKMLVAEIPEFGNEYGNDHHFHYGYYIRAAAILVAEKPELRATFEPIISEMIQDIANTDRVEERYPFLRAFSPYEGHSWADGRGKFADGNNQESTSEALNAWYAVKIWGEVTEQPQLVETGTWLFSQELEGVKSYWYGIDNPFPNGYQYPIASIVWGGKKDFSTWFSGQPMHIYGIQWLPVTPGSDYLGEVTNNSQYWQKLTQIDPEYLTHEWADLAVATRSYTYPEQAIEQLKSVQTFAGIKLESLLLQTVYGNAERQ